MYGKLNAIYEKTRLDIFAMAYGYLIEKGVETVSEITDEEIAEMKGNGLMTEDFCKSLVKLAREIAQATDSGVELIQFADIKSIYDAYNYTNGEHFSRHALEKMVSKLCNDVIYETDMPYPNSEEEARENLADYLDIDIDDIDTLLGYE